MSKPLYKRYCEITINGRRFTGPPFTIEFEMEFGTKTSNQAKAVLYNTSDDTVASCEKKKGVNPKVVVTAGYESDYGTCITGEIIKFEAGKGIDKPLTLTIAENTAAWTTATINKSWKGQISARDVIKQTLASVGITPAKIDLEVEKVYTRGIAFSGIPLSSAMKILAQDTKSDFFFKNCQAYFLKEKSASAVTAFYLTPETGLLNARKTEKGYNVQTLFLYQIGSGSPVKIEGSEAKGLFKAVSGKHKFSTKEQSSTEFEAVKL